MRSFAIQKGVHWRCKINFIDATSSHDSSVKMIVEMCKEITVTRFTLRQPSKDPFIIKDIVFRPFHWGLCG